MTSLDGLRALEQAATSAPWITYYDDGTDPDGHQILMASALPVGDYPNSWHMPGSWQPQHRIEYDHGLYEEDGEQYAEAEANAALVVAARNALPGLFGRVAAAEAERDALRAEVEREVNGIGFALAVWCPHGFDSSRTSDYGTAGEIRAAFERLRAVLVASVPSGPAEEEA